MTFASLRAPPGTANVPGPDTPASEGEPTPATQLPESAAPHPPELPRLPGSEGPRRPARYGLQIRFEKRPDDPSLGRLVESTVWVNEAHPAYGRAVATRAEGYHLALATAMAIGPLAVEPARVPEFVTTFLARWGESVGGRRHQRRA